MTKLILLLSFLIAAPPALAGHLPNCAPALSRPALDTTHARFKADIARLAAPFSQLQIHVESDDNFLPNEGFPVVPKPATSDSTYFKVVIRAHDGPHEFDFAQGFNIVPKLIDQNGRPTLQFEVEASVETDSTAKVSERATLQNLELMSLFVALSATPYTHYLRITQRLDPADHHAGPMTAKTFKAIRESKMQGLTDRLTVRQHWPWLVETLGENGFPISYNTPRIYAYREVKNQIQACLPDKAESFLIEYEYLILDPALLH